MAEVSIRRRWHLRFWRVVDPWTRRLAGVMPWWVLLETTGRSSGLPRRTPLARGPKDGETFWLIAVHGRQAHWVRNIEMTPLVRIRMNGRWHAGCASVQPWDAKMLSRFSAYARSGRRAFGIEPVMIAIRLSGT